MEKYYRASEIAVRYNAHPTSVKRWIKNGLFPNAKFEVTIAGSIWLIPESDLENFSPPQIGRPSKKKSD